MKDLHPLFMDFPVEQNLKVWLDFLTELQDLQTGNYYFVDDYIEQAKKTIETMQGQAVANFDFLNTQFNKVYKPK